MSIVIGIASGVLGFIVGAFAMVVMIADAMDDHKED